jgi:ribosomal protein S3AE
VSYAAVYVRRALVCEADHDVSSEVDVHTEDVEVLRVSAVLASKHVYDLVQSLTLRPLVPLLAFEQL